MESRPSPSLPRVHPSVRIPSSSSATLNGLDYANNLSNESGGDSIYTVQQPHFKRWNLSKEDLLILEETFLANVEEIKSDTKHELAEKLKIPPHAVELWFTKRRAKYKSEKLEEKSVVSKAHYLNCMAYLDKLAKRNETLMQIPVAATNGKLITLDEDTTNGSELLQLVDARDLCVGHTKERGNESHEEDSPAEECDYLQGLENIVEEGDNYMTNCSMPFSGA